MLHAAARARPNRATCGVRQLAPLPTPPPPTLLGVCETESQREHEREHEPRRATRRHILCSVQSGQHSLGRAPERGTEQLS